MRIIRIALSTALCMAFIWVARFADPTYGSVYWVTFVALWLANIAGYVEAPLAQKGERS